MSWLRNITLGAGSSGQAVHGEGDDPLSHEDCQVAVDLCDSMSLGYATEVEREQAFNHIMERYLGKTIRKEFPNAASTAATDGSICCSISIDGAPLDVLVYIQEIKLEVGWVQLARLVRVRSQDITLGHCNVHGAGREQERSIISTSWPWVSPFAAFLINPTVGGVLYLWQRTGPKNGPCGRPMLPCSPRVAPAVHLPYGERCAPCCRRRLAHRVTRTFRGSATIRCT